jgi:hypothetical protein
VPVVAVPERESGRHTGLHRQFRRDRELVGTATDTVRPEVFLCHLPAVAPFSVAPAPSSHTAILRLVALKNGKLPLAGLGQAGKD